MRRLHSQALAVNEGSLDFRGWIKLHRRLFDNPRAKDPEWLSVWIYLLTNATHQPYPAVFCGKAITLRPGQLITGRFAIEKKTGVHNSKVFRLLKLMEIEHQIKQQPVIKTP